MKLAIVHATVLKAVETAIQEIKGEVTIIRTMTLVERGEGACETLMSASNVGKRVIMQVRARMNQVRTAAITNQDHAQWKDHYSASNAARRGIMQEIVQTQMTRITI